MTATLSLNNAGHIGREVEEPCTMKAERATFQPCQFHDVRTNTYTVNNNVDNNRNRQLTLILKQRHLAFARRCELI